ncbi:MAG TPA: V-type ATPase subunit [Gemmatimonadales bacterium]|nr:V-type ATPase subunit [Gemmatimonadales bacterium]
MSPRWEDVNARARGLGTHLLDRGRLEALAAAPDLGALAEALGRAGIAIGAGDGATAEAGIRQWSAGILRTLQRWVGARSDALPLVFDDEDRRSIRALIRGAAAGVPAEARLLALLPTPALPAAALEALAALHTVEEVAALLAAWRHPFAGAAAAAVGAEPDLLAFDRALADAARQRAERAARRSGSRALRRLVAELFATDPAADGPEELRARIRRLGREVRLAPLDPLTTLWVVLRLRGQVIDLQRIAWAVTLGAPRALLRDRWISVAA